ncbi:hypothetical protein [Alloscardovia sp. HMSC034E08]|uniref:hypothetical protein n=1 Tax=Alloscardovia sp. HMSC034E08 TaxID=1739413 RepID=UPI0008BE93D4|nr:hypothetical protein [Alloscardovia sp. HMSC034E08]OFQ97527.1 hypothetical protein HMPREF2909_02870 [Alloscardovia sp. HMSC034E08]
MRTKIDVLSLVAMLVTGATAVCYALTTDRSHSWTVVILLALAVLTQLIHACATRIAWLEYVPFVIVLAATGLFVKLGTDEAYAIMSKVNMMGLSKLWIASAVLLGVSVLITAASTIFVKKSNQAEE